jgi:ElaB/YqjD/DUF883 family membrane-anchored ribosome-binding protein
VFIHLEENHVDESGSLLWHREGLRRPGRRRFGRVTDKTEVEGKMKQAAGAAQDLYAQAKDAAGDAAKSVQEQAAPLEGFLRNTIETRPYTAVAVALGLGWFIGRMGGRADY